LFDGAAKGVLGATACERFDKASDGLVAVRTPTDAFDVLRKVRMGITVQQMVLVARTGDIWLSGRKYGLNSG
ncbi:MAG: hypothetical protein AAGE52_33235, partial [Myxococcota bacterium]